MKTVNVTITSLKIREVKPSANNPSGRVADIFGFADRKAVRGAIFAPETIEFLEGAVATASIEEARVIVRFTEPWSLSGRPVMTSQDADAAVVKDRFDRPLHELLLPEGAVGPLAIVGFADKPKAVVTQTAADVTAMLEAYKKAKGNPAPAPAPAPAPKAADK